MLGRERNTLRRLRLDNRVSAGSNNDIFVCPSDVTAGRELGVKELLAIQVSSSIFIGISYKPERSDRKLLQQLQVERKSKTETRKLRALGHQPEPQILEKEKK